MSLCMAGGDNKGWCSEVDSPGAYGPLADLAAAAGNGDSTAQSRLGDIHRLGIGVQKDDVQAFEWYRKAATSGYAPAQTLLAALYDNGVGVSKDGDKAIAWYCEAAAQGNRRAQTNLEIKRTYGLFNPDECPARRALR